jgi:hypothetical protein
MDAAREAAVSRMHGGIRFRAAIAAASNRICVGKRVRTIC